MTQEYNPKNNEIDPSENTSKTFLTDYSPYFPPEESKPPRYFLATQQNK